MKQLGDAERALYNQMKTYGPMSPEESALYSKAVFRNLIAAQLVRLREDGGHEVLVRAEYAPGVAHTDSRAEHPSAPPPPPRISMATLTSRVPAQDIPRLDELATAAGVTRSEYLRNILQSALYPSTPPAPVSAGPRRRKPSPAGGTRRATPAGGTRAHGAS
jgi:hypothetical protein